MAAVDAQCAGSQAVYEQRFAADKTTLSILLDDILARHHGAVQVLGAIFYGSCLRRKGIATGLVDLYLIVENHRVPYASRWQRLLNVLLPPNVHYHETRLEDGRKIRCKYAIFSLSAYETGCSRWFHSYLYARMAQPVVLLRCRDEEIHARLGRGLAAAVCRLHAETLPLMTGTFSCRELWRKALILTYGCELRAESMSSWIETLLDDVEPHCEQLTAVFMHEYADLFAIESTSGNLWRATMGADSVCRFSWSVRKYQGKLLSAARLIKGLATFSCGVDYIADKLERHSGRKVEFSDRERRWPLIFIWKKLWQLYRKGFFG